MENKNEKIELLYNTREYIENVINAIEKMTDNFYKEENKEGCNLVARISEGLEWIIKALRLTNDIINLNDILDEMTEKFNDIVEALENEDYILVADIFKYEIKVLLENIKEELLKVN